MLLVSIHDVSPAQAAAVTRLWEVCVERRVIPALLVVPNWHGEWPLEEHPDFVEWIRRRAAEGAEIVLHGERHDEVGLPRGAGDHRRAWGKTAGEAEFLTLDAAAAEARITRGLGRLRKVGLEPVGFVPPAWLAREAAHEAAASAGLHFSEDDHSVRLFPSGRRMASPVLRWSARTAARAWGSVAVARIRSVVQRRAGVVRIALHPRDLDHPATARSLTHTLDRWLGWHRAGHYGDLAVTAHCA
ncbi:MAG TPA: polysaccharide deacetylase family protein [Gemmatimonadales bacterium]|nr:polysaccharide deacetylase family protein [Gemmatimonadales bacterium]